MGLLLSLCANGCATTPTVEEPVPTRQIIRQELGLFLNWMHSRRYLLRPWSLGPPIPVDPETHEPLPDPKPKTLEEINNDPKLLELLKEAAETTCPSL